MTQNYSQGYYWYYATRDEALNWPIAPGNMLTFKDPDGKHYYEKSLGWNPCEGVQFKEYKIREATAPVQESIVEVAPTKTNDVEALRLDMDDLKRQMTEFIKAMQPHMHSYDNKKGGDKR